jgi:hypothetical protein
MVNNNGNGQSDAACNIQNEADTRIYRDETRLSQARQKVIRFTIVEQVDILENAKAIFEGCRLPVRLSNPLMHRSAPKLAEFKCI